MPLEPTEITVEDIDRLTPSQVEQMHDLLMEPTRITEVEKWCQHYMPHYFSLPFPDFRKDFIKEIRPGNKTKKFAIAEPRAHGKTTFWSIGLPLWAIAEGGFNFVVIFGSSSQNAQANLNSITTELEENSRLKEEYPALRPRMDLYSNNEQWTDTDIVMESNQKISARGMGTRTRGIKFKQHRPDLIIVDDIEDETNVNTEFQREKTLNYVTDVIMNLEGASGALQVFVGTIINNYSLIAKFVSPEQFTYLHKSSFSAIDPSTYLDWKEDSALGKALWPEAWSPERLKEKFNEIGERAFLKEFQNRPEDDTTIVFRLEEFQFFEVNREGEFGRKDLTHLCFVDPSAGKKAGCDTSIAILAVDHEHCYVVDWITAQLNPTGMFKRLADEHDKYSFYQIDIEANGMQDTLFSIPELLNLEYLPIQRFYQKKAKERRIVDWLQGAISTGQMLFHPNWKDKREYVTGMKQLLDYYPGKSQELDGPDALAGVKNMAAMHTGFAEGCSYSYGH